MRTELGDTLIEVPEKSMVSITEASEYIDPDNPNVEQLREGRLHPRDLPDTRVVCIYPMSKSREVGANYYSDPDHKIEPMRDEFRKETAAAGLVLDDLKTPWGEIWATLHPRESVRS